jgi:hypothetical protein
MAQKLVEIPSVSDTKQYIRGEISLGKCRKEKEDALLRRYSDKLKKVVLAETVSRSGISIFDLGTTLRAMHGWPNRNPLQDVLDVAKKQHKGVLFYCEDKPIIGGAEFYYFAEKGEYNRAEADFSCGIGREETDGISKFSISFQYNELGRMLADPVLDPFRQS